MEGAFIFSILLLPKRQYLSPIVRAPPRAFLCASTLAHPRCYWVWMWGICWIYPPPPHTLTATTRIIPFLVGNPYKPSFVTVTGWGVDRRNLHNKHQLSHKRKNGLTFYYTGWLIGILTMVHDIPHVTGKNSGPEFSIGRYPCVGEVSCSYQRSTYSSRGNCCLVAVWTEQVFFHFNCLEWKSQIRTTLISWF